MQGERKSHIKRDLAIVTIGALVSTSVIGFMESRETQCTGKIDWSERHRNIAICHDKDGNLIAQGPYTIPRVLHGIKDADNLWSVNNRLL